MKKLAEIYNPLSDTFLVMAQGRAGRFHVFRQARSPEFIIAKGVHDGRFALSSTENRDDAARLFEQRLGEEKEKSIYEFSGPLYEGGKDDEKTRALKKWNESKIGQFRDKFSNAAYDYEICDTPRRKVYAFEKAFFGSPEDRLLTTDKVLALVEQVSNDFELMDIPAVKFRDHPIFETHLGERREIRAATTATMFPEIIFKWDRGMVCKQIVLHEMAHVITLEFFPNAIPHGPHFARIAAMLYDRYLDIDRDKYFEQANDSRFMIFGPLPCMAEEVLSRELFNAAQFPVSNTRHLSLQRPA